MKPKRLEVGGLDLRLPFYVGGPAMGNAVYLTVAELHVIDVVAFAAQLPETAGGHRHRVRNGQKTRHNPEQPWNLSAHASTASKLEERGFLLSKLDLDRSNEHRLHYDLTERGQKLVDQVAMRRKSLASIAKFDAERKASVYTIASSHGTMSIDADGKPIGDVPGELAHIERFDVVEFLRWCRTSKLPEVETIDILEIGFWTKAGAYEAAETDMRKEIIVAHVHEARLALLRKANTP